jgi:hypothetical protein
MKDEKKGINKLLNAHSVDVEDLYQNLDIRFKNRDSSYR